MKAYVYIMASKKNGTLYTGVTTKLSQRISQHKQGENDGFTKKYAVKHLVYLEVHDRIDEAIHREKCIKEWRRQWKINLINKANPQWSDLSYQLSIE